MVDENELNKQLGLQDYWSYVQLPIGNASGYINTSSGNLAYQQVDVAISAPLLASTMRRTYNSQAKSYTALGKGWDFGLNTNLLREYDKTTGEEVGLILKTAMEPFTVLQNRRTAATNHRPGYLLRFLNGRMGSIRRIARMTLTICSTNP